MSFMKWREVARSWINLGTPYSWLRSHLSCLWVGGAKEQEMGDIILNRWRKVSSFCLQRWYIKNVCEWDCKVNCWNNCFLLRYACLDFLLLVVGLWLMQCMINIHSTCLAVTDMFSSFCSVTQRLCARLFLSLSVPIYAVWWAGIHIYLMYYCNCSKWASVERRSNWCYLIMGISFAGRFLQASTFPSSSNFPLLPGLFLLEWPFGYGFCTIYTYSMHTYVWVSGVTFK